VVEQDTLAELVSLLRRGKVTVLTGAGLSTESGIPDYRGPSGALRRQTPMTLQAFTSGDLARRRYWARSTLGWRTSATLVPTRATELSRSWNASGC
jgi:NAD-dependent SIR2 family protein deacetylase